MSEDNWNDPEQVVFEVFVVTEVVSIASEKVTETLSVTETPLWLSVGYVEETVGAVVSLVLVLDLLPLQEMMVKLISRERIMSRCFNWFPKLVGFIKRT